MKCPSCGLINPETAQLCDCGYDFEKQEVTTPSPASASPGTLVRKFKVLFAYAKVVEIVGWMTVIAGMIWLLAAVAGASVTETQRSLTAIVVAALPAGGVLVGGVLLVIVGQSVLVALEIEKNTRQTADRCEHMVDLLRRCIESR